MSKVGGAVFSSSKIEPKSREPGMSTGTSYELLNSRCSLVLFASSASSDATSVAAAAAMLLLLLLLLLASDAAASASAAATAAAAAAAAVAIPATNCFLDSLRTRSRV